MPEVNPIEAGGQAKVGTVIHDESHALAGSDPELAGVTEDLSSTSLLIAILDQGRSAGNELASKSKKFLGAGEIGCVNDRIEAGQHG